MEKLLKTLPMMEPYSGPPYMIGIFFVSRAYHGLPDAFDEQPIGLYEKFVSQAKEIASKSFL